MSLFQLQPVFSLLCAGPDASTTAPTPDPTPKAKAKAKSRAKAKAGSGKGVTEVTAKTHDELKAEICALLSSDHTSLSFIVAAYWLHI